MKKQKPNKSACEAAPEDDFFLTSIKKKGFCHVKPIYLC